MAGEPFARDDGWLLRLEPPAFKRPNQRPPDPHRPERVREAAHRAQALMEKGVKLSRAKAEAAEACEVLPREIDADWKEWPEA